VAVGNETVRVSGEDPLRRLNGDPRLVPAGSLTAHPTTVAAALLGYLLVRDEDDGERTVIRIVETEAYHQDDPASHSYRGPTPRNEVMFGPAGRLYVYFTYGMHWCANIVTGPPGVGAAVLIRAGVAVRGRHRIRARRGERPTQRDLLRGPARLTSGLGLDGDWNGCDLLRSDVPLRLERDEWRPSPAQISAGPRTGIRLAADVRWRYWLEGVPEVSRYTRSPKADAPRQRSIRGGSDRIGNTERLGGVGQRGAGQDPL
jgi:DNA-3-methyladenine glycosylase